MHKLCKLQVIFLNHFFIFAWSVNDFFRSPGNENIYTVYLYYVINQHVHINKYILSYNIHRRVSVASTTIIRVSYKNTHA
jgi:hypothetical protein